MKKTLTQNAGKTAKACTILCLVLVICYGLAVMNDFNLFHQQIGAVMSTAAAAELHSFSHVFMSIAAAKCLMFLVPAGACGLTAVILKLASRFMPAAAVQAEPVRA